jgi:hypothetical protein
MSTIMPETIAEKRTYLETLGYVIGDRDPRLNTNFIGAYMIVDDDYKDYKLPTRDGSNGPWCIVGDDLDELIEHAFTVWFDPIFEKENHERALKIALSTHTKGD